jgi:hypothetical protein
MNTVEYRVEVDLDPIATWAKLSDFTLAINYVPGLTDLEITTEQTTGVGASRLVVSGEKLKLDETVVEWTDNEGFVLRLHRGDEGPIPPMTEAYFDYNMIVEGDQVYLHNRMRYKVGLGPLGRFLDWLAIRKVVAGSVRDATIAQKLFYESGEKVGKERLAEAKKQLP